MIRNGNTMLIPGLFFVFMMVSCSGNADINPINPSDPGQNSVIQNEISDASPRDDNRYLWGFWQVRYNPEDNSTEVTPIRETMGHWNVLKFLEGGPCTNCLKILSGTPMGDGTVLFDVQIKHPFQNLNFSGFDVRGISIFEGSHFFPEAGLVVSDRLSGEGELMNANGYTPLYNIFTMGDGPLKGYYKGKFGSVQDPMTTLNGYRTFSSSLPSNNPRNVFLAGDTLTNGFIIDMPTTFIFNYAVDASWVPPTVNPVVDPEIDFPPEANMPEPWKIRVAEDGPGLSEIGGYADLTVQVYDHGGFSTHGTPTVECPELFTGTVSLAFQSSDPEYSSWLVEVTNNLAAPPGIYKVLIKVVDNYVPPTPPLVHESYYVYDLEVRPNSGYVKTWGGVGLDSSWGVGVTNDNYVFVGGFYDVDASGIDFDPGKGGDYAYSEGLTDIFVTKFDLTGGQIWTITMGGPGIEAITDLEVVGDDVYICGYFSETMDFDPGPDTHLRSSAGFFDAFLAKYDANGNYVWAKTWGGTLNVLANDMELSTSTIVVGGNFVGTADLDPESTVASHDSQGQSDGYTSFFDTNGTYNGSWIFGGTGETTINAVEWANAMPQVFVGGSNVNGDVDLNPQFPELKMNTGGDRQAFILKIDEIGNLLWDRQYLSISTGDVYLWDIDSKAGTLNAAGSFAGTVDFSPDVVPHYSISWGGQDAFVLQLNYNGDYFWHNSYGSTGNDYAYAVGFTPTLETYLGGMFEGSVDFDPGTGDDTRVSNGFADGFVTRLDSTSGSKMWVNTFGSAEGNESVTKMAGSVSYDIYSVGNYSGITDFDPSGTDNHTSNGLTDCFLLKHWSDGSW